MTQTLEWMNTTEQTQTLTRDINSLNRTQISFKDIKVLKEIGEGSYGKACLGKWNAAPVALKFCKKKGKIEDFMKDIKLMMYVSNDISILIRY
jgi:predicted Ser/Thr protein kinase